MAVVIDEMQVDTVERPQQQQQRGGAAEGGGGGGGGGGGEAPPARRGGAHLAEAARATRARARLLSQRCHSTRQAALKNRDRPSTSAARRSQAPRLGFSACSSRSRRVGSTAARRSLATGGRRTLRPTSSTSTARCSTSASSSR